jgi:hypothetical protein
MHPEKNVFRGILVLLFACIASPALQDRLQGRWEGTAQSLQGERQVQATFKKEGPGYTGTITGLRGDLTLKEIKVEGDKVTAMAEVETPQGTITVRYEFALLG